MDEEVDEGRRLNLTIITELHNALRIRAVIEGKNMSRVVEDALNVCLESTVKRGDDNE